MAYFPSTQLEPFSLFQECPVGEKDWIVRIKDQLKKLFPNKEFYLVCWTSDFIG